MGIQKEKLIEEMDYMSQARPALFLTVLEYNNYLNQIKHEQSKRQFQGQNK